MAWGRRLIDQIGITRGWLSRGVLRGVSQFSCSPGRTFLLRRVKVSDGSKSKFQHSILHNTHCERNNNHCNARGAHFCFVRDIISPFTRCSSTSFRIDTLTPM